MCAHKIKEEYTDGCYRDCSNSRGSATGGSDTSNVQNKETKR